MAVDEKVVTQIKEAKDFCIAGYPEGYERVKSELLSFLPENDADREAYMKSMISFLVRA